MCMHIVNIMKVLNLIVTFSVQYDSKIFKGLKFPIFKLKFTLLLNAYFLATTTGGNHAKKSGNVKMIGPYLLWNNIGGSPVDCVQNLLVRKIGTNKFFVLKVLQNICDNSDIGLHGKNMIHTEYTILRFLEGENGVIQQHGLFKYVAEDENGEKYNRLCLVLDCYVNHDFTPEYQAITNLQDYVRTMKCIREKEALDLFYKILLIVQRLHAENIIHHDLKLGNIILNTITREVKLTNFWLSRKLIKAINLFQDRRWSPIYAPPEAVANRPYLGKPSDMWSLGIVFYAMLYGQFPFCSEIPSILFQEIKIGHFEIPSVPHVSSNSVQLIQSLLVTDPVGRPTCDQTLARIARYYDSVAAESESDDKTLPQVVPHVMSSSSDDEFNKLLTNEFDTSKLPTPFSAFIQNPPRTFRQLKRVGSLTK